MSIKPSFIELIHSPSSSFYLVFSSAIFSLIASVFEFLWIQGFRIASPLGIWAFLTVNKEVSVLKTLHMRHFLLYLNSSLSLVHKKVRLQLHLQRYPWSVGGDINGPHPRMRCSSVPPTEVENIWDKFGHLPM